MCLRAVCYYRRAPRSFAIVATQDNLDVLTISFITPYRACTLGVFEHTLGLTRILRSVRIDDDIYVAQYRNILIFRGKYAVLNRPLNYHRMIMQLVRCVDAAARSPKVAILLLHLARHRFKPIAPPKVYLPPPRLPRTRSETL